MTINPNVTKDGSVVAPFVLFIFTPSDALKVGFQRLFLATIKNLYQIAFFPPPQHQTQKILPMQKSANKFQEIRLYWSIEKPLCFNGMNMNIMSDVRTGPVALVFTIASRNQ